MKKKSQYIKKTQAGALVRKAVRDGINDTILAERLNVIMDDMDQAKHFNRMNYSISKKIFEKIPKPSKFKESLWTIFKAILWSLALIGSDYFNIPTWAFEGLKLLLH